MYTHVANSYKAKGSSCDGEETYKNKYLVRLKQEPMKGFLLKVINDNLLNEALEHTVKQYNSAKCNEQYKMSFNATRIQVKHLLMNTVV